MTTIARLEPPRVTVGVDTHGEVHVACALDQLGRHLATTRVATTPRGDRALLAWARRLGEVAAWGVEGTGCYGAALARFLNGQGQLVWEVNRPDRQARRHQGKSDPVDAQTANALRALVVTAPAELREQLRGLSAAQLASTAARPRPGPILTTTAATKLALRLWRALSGLGR